MKLTVKIDGKHINQKMLSAIDYFKLLESRQCNDVDIESCISDYIDALLTTDDRCFVFGVEN